MTQIKKPAKPTQAEKLDVVPVARHGLRLLKSPAAQAESTINKPSQNSLVKNLQTLADSLDAEIAMILKM